MEGKHFVVSCSLTIGNKIIHTHALIDCGATGISFVDKDFAHHHQLPLKTLKTPRSLEVIDGRPVSSGDITQLTNIPFSIQEHHEQLPMFVTKLGHYPIVLGIPWLNLHDVAIRFSSRTLTFGSQYCTAHCNRSPTTVTALSEEPPEPHYSISTSKEKLHIACLSSQSFDSLVNQQGLSITPLSLYEINKALEKPPKDLDTAVIVPLEYHSYLPLFEEALANELPPHRPYDHRIPLKDGFIPPFGPLYSLSRDELVALRDWLKENLAKGFIRRSSSPAASPILFVKKSDGTLRLCVDYRGLNEGTIKNRYPLPLIQETLMQLSKAKYFTTLDIRGAYNLVRMAEGEEWKTAFRTRYGLFETLVMPFGLTNAPADFQAFINDVLRPFLDQFCTAYLDDILIYSNNLEEHKGHVLKILEVLSKAKLHLKPEKCKFHQTEVKYLGMIIGREGIQIDPKKIETIVQWEKPKVLRDVREFIGFANYSRRHIKDYSKVTSPLTALTKMKDGKLVPFVWEEEQQLAFETLKHKFTTAPILKHFDYEKECIVETDASDYVSAGVLSQYNDKGILHPIGYFSKKHSPAECNYEIYDKELLAIVRCFEEWRPHLQGSRYPIQVLSDHKNLEYFMTTKLLNRRQARWSEFLSRFNFKITYRPGKAGGKPDALTRRSGDLPKEGDERIIANQQAILKPQNIDKSLRLLADLPQNQERPSLKTLFDLGYEADPFPSQIIQMLADNIQSSKEISLADCKVTNGQLRYRDCIYVPNYDPLRLRILQDHHDPPTMGHPGRAKTLELISRNYYWPTLRKSVDQFVRNCHVCRRTKATRHAPYGMLKPLPVPHHPWQHVSVDFITGLPTSEGFDAICAIVCRLTKQRHLVPCHTTIDAEGFAQLFIDNVFRLHGLPENLVSDRGPQFIARFWTHLASCLGISISTSTAFHPQTDGQTERINAVLEQYLRAYVTYLQNDWKKYLSLAEFAANNQVSDTTTLSPFFGIYGRHPKCSFQLDQATTNPEEINAQETAERLSHIHDTLRSEMKYAQARQIEGADRSRTPAPVFRQNDLVWLDSRNIRTERPSRKLENKFLGPYKVTRAIGTHAYEIDIPNTMRNHRTFPVSLLYPAANDPLPGQTTPPPLPVIVDGEENWEVKEVLDSRRRRGKLEYLIQWVGYTSPTWEPEEYMTDVPSISKFHELFPDKPRPLS